jgi:hypothetical protein
MKKLKFIIPISICIVLFLLVLACGGTNENVPEKVEEVINEETETSETSEKQSTQEEKQQISKEKEVQEFFEIGDNVNLDGTIVTVKGVEKSSGDDFDQPKNGMEYVIITINIKNSSDDKISYNPFDFKVQNSNGQITDIAFTIVDTETALESGELAVGGEVEGTITFEEPIGDSGLILIYQPSFWFDDRVVKIKLN